MQIHVSNLHPNLIESDVQRLFFPYGEIDSVKLLRDKWTNRSHGHAFVEMPVPKEAAKAVISLNGMEVKGKRLSVSKVVYDPAPNASFNISQDV